MTNRRHLCIYCALGQRCGQQGDTRQIAEAQKRGNASARLEGVSLRALAAHGARGGPARIPSCARACGGVSSRALLRGRMVTPASDVQAANFMGVKELVDELCKFVAHNIAMRTPHEILDYFNIKKDATWEEEQDLINTHTVSAVASFAPRALLGCKSVLRCSRALASGLASPQFGREHEVALHHRTHASQSSALLQGQPAYTDCGARCKAASTAYGDLPARRTP